MDDIPDYLTVHSPGPEDCSDQQGSEEIINARPGQGPETIGQLMDHVFRLVQDVRIRDEVGVLARLLKGREIRGKRLVAWIEHAALASAGKVNPAAYFRSVVLGLLEKGGTPQELREKELKEVHRTVTEDQVSPGMVEQVRSRCRDDFDERLRREIGEWDRARPEIRAEVIRRVQAVHGPAEQFLPDVFTGICIHFHNEFQRGNI